jgi:hypothetical protein
MTKESETVTGSKFTPITSQEQLNTVIAERIKRAEAKAVEPFKDYDDLKEKAAKYVEGQNAAKSVEDKAAEQIAKLQKQIDGLNDNLTQSQSEAVKARIQAKYKISDDDAALFLTATDTDVLDKQAKALSERIADRKKGAPFVPEQRGHTDPPVDENAQFAAQLFGKSD